MELRRPWPAVLRAYALAPATIARVGLPSCSTPVNTPTLPARVTPGAPVSHRVVAVCEPVRTVSLGDAMSRAPADDAIRRAYCFCSVWPDSTPIVVGRVGRQVGHASRDRHTRVRHADHVARLRLSITTTTPRRCFGSSLVLGLVAPLLTSEGVPPPWTSVPPVPVGQ